MSKEHRLKAMGAVLNAEQRHSSDDMELGAAVRQIVADLRKEEAEFRAQQRAEHEANAAKKQASPAPAIGPAPPTALGANLIENR